MGTKVRLKWSKRVSKLVSGLKPFLDKCNISEANHFGIAFSCFQTCLNACSSGLMESEVFYMQEVCSMLINARTTTPHMLQGDNLG